MPEVPPFLYGQRGTFNSPVTYTVPGAGEVQPYTATATYVNASGQAISPALRIKSSDGSLLALVFPGETIADGTSSEVTFVPPFGSAASSPAPAATGAVEAAFAFLYGTDEGGTNVNVGAASAGNPNGANILFTDSTQFYSTNTDVFSWVGNKIRIKKPGIYRALFQCQFSNDPLVTDQTVRIQTNGVFATEDTAGAPLGEKNASFYGYDTAFSMGALPGTVEILQTWRDFWERSDDVPDDIFVTFYNLSSSVRHVATRMLYVVQLRSVDFPLVGFPSFP